jgi:protein-L-isoaspartate(D-aspartate) O-methyltransferase
VKPLTNHCARWLAPAIVLFAVSPCMGQTERQWAAARGLMVESEVATAGVKQPAVLAAMRAVPRHEFVPAESRPYAYFDMALPIGERQTISPPFIVAWMTQQLDPRPTDRVLEVGTGSGYQAAVLSRLVKRVYTIEINKPLAERARATIKRLGYENVAIKIGDGYEGWPEHAPFDKIIVTCSPENVPPALAAQLREGGRIVIPLGERYQQTLCTLVKRDGELAIQSREPTFFVPMTGQAESLRSATSSEAVTPLANGNFEQLLAFAKPAAWYYLRQATIDAGGPIGDAPHCIVFANLVPGRGSQALQAIGVDGRRVSELAVDLWVKADDVQPAVASDRQTGAKLVISFFDDDRSPAGFQVVGPWQGNFDWRRQNARLKVPFTARAAVVAVGLSGATGRLSCDEIEIRAAPSRTARRGP